MATIFGATTDNLIALPLTCKCPSGRRRLPIRMARSTLKQIRDKVSPDQLLFTHRCSDCQSITQIKGRDLKGISA